MADFKTGRVVGWRKLSPVLATFRLLPQDGERFPDYRPGQYMALRREGCWLTRRVVAPDGRVDYVPDRDDSGEARLGAVTHSYSIASAPFETTQDGHLEFYVVLETNPHGIPGRLSGSLFKLNPPLDDELHYVNRIAGNFTLEHRARGFRSVFLIGSGTGLAPFVSMVKQLHVEAADGKANGVQYTLLHANRTYEELAYHEELVSLAAARRIDLVYVASVSRPTPRDVLDPHIARGRANNVLRHILGLPMKEEQDVEEAAARGADLPARAALERSVRAVLPRHLSPDDLRQRLDPAGTVIMSCGNPSLMADIRSVADATGVRFEKEDW